jgi:hypothetical protein
MADTDRELRVEECVVDEGNRRDEKRVAQLAEVRSVLRGRDYGPELLASRVMLLRLAELASRYDSPESAVVFSREIARQLEAIGNLLLKAQVQQEADSLVGRLMEEILAEMNRDQTAGR